MKKVVQGKLKKTLETYDEKYQYFRPITTLERKISFLDTELEKLEKEMEQCTLDFLQKQNQFGINLISGISSCTYIPSLNGENDYSFKLIGGTTGRNNNILIDENTIFDVASITKLFTLIALLKSNDLGIISLDSKISDINPDFQDLEDFTLNDLMRLHGKYWTNGNIALAKSSETAYEILKTIHLIDNTREINTYNDFGAIVIADTLTKRMSEIYGIKLTYEEVLRILLLNPLNMNYTCYNPSTNNVSGNGSGINIVHDPKARALGGICGHAGLFTNAEDLNLLAREVFLANDNKSMILTKNIIDKVSEQTFPNGEHPEKGNLGVFLKNSNGKTYVPTQFSDKSFAYEGWTGSVAVFDPENQIHQSVLVNAIYQTSNKEHVKNDKPISYKEELKSYQEKIALIAMKMRHVIKQYDECLEILTKSKEKNKILKKKYI